MRCWNGTSLPIYVSLTWLMSPLELHGAWPTGKRVSETSLPETSMSETSLSETLTPDPTPHRPRSECCPRDLTFRDIHVRHCPRPHIEGMHRWNGTFLLYILPSGCSQKVCAVGMAPSSAFKCYWLTVGMAPLSCICFPHMAHKRHAPLECHLTPLNFTLGMHHRNGTFLL